MSTHETDTSIQEMEDFLAEKVFGQAPRSVSEAVEALPEPPAEPREDEETVVRDEPPEAPPLPPAAPPPVPERDTEGDTTEGEEGAEPGAEPDQEDTEEDTPQNLNVAWATQKYGDRPEMWAKAARDMELHITRLTQEKRDAEALTQQWQEYAENVEGQARRSTAMPLSAGEEEWVQASVINPLEYARNAAFSGNVPLFNAVINEVAEQDPGLAARVSAQVQVELRDYAAMEEQARSTGPPSMESGLAQSFGRLGLDLTAHGPAMSAKIAQLGEYHPYVQAIINGDDGQRDIALQAVYDLAQTTTTRPVSKAVEEENQMRREAAVVQTGGISPPPAAPKRPPLLAQMEEEWRRAGQWKDD